MCKVVIDSFDSEEDAIAFISWFKKTADADEINLITTKGTRYINWNGIDLRSSTNKLKVFNITTVDFEEN